MTDSRPDYVTPDGAGAWRLTVMVQPGGSRDEVAGPYQDRLRIRIRAKAVDGRANAALTGFLADVLGLRPRQVRIVAGLRDRRKTLRVEATEEPGWAALVRPGT